MYNYACWICLAITNGLLIVHTDKKGFLNFLKYTDSTPIASEWEVWTKVKKQNARADRTGNKLESGFFSSYWELSFSRKIY